MKNEKLCAFSILAAGLILAGAMLPVAVKVMKSYDRTVSVRGLCEREVKADKVIWPIRFKVASNDLGTIYREIDSKQKSIEAFLKNGGVNQSEISASLPEISDRDAQEYGSGNRIYRYISAVTVTVCTNDVDRILALMQEQNKLIEQGIVIESSYDSQPSFSFEGLNSIKPEMIQEATANAREAAQKFANDSGSRIGKIKNASQGVFSINDRDSNTPQIKKVRVVTNVDYYLSR